MRRVVAWVFLALLCLVLVLSVAFLIYSIFDIPRVKGELARDPSASGIDYWGIGWGYGIGLFCLSLFGLTLGIINLHLQKRELLQYGCVVSVILFGMLMAASFCLLTA